MMIPQLAMYIMHILTVCSVIQVLHYVEKPETFVSEVINCGIYIFSPAALFKLMGEVLQKNYQKIRCVDEVNYKHDYYSTITSFYHIRTRDCAKYESVFHCTKQIAL